MYAQANSAAYPQRNGKCLLAYLTSLLKLIWEDGRAAVLLHTYAVKSPLVYNGAPQIRPQKYPFPWTDPQTPLPALSLDPSDIWCQTASGSDPPLCHNALDRPTDARTYVRTDRSSTEEFGDYGPLRYESDAA